MFGVRWRKTSRLNCRLESRLLWRLLRRCKGLNCLCGCRSREIEGDLCIQHALHGCSGVGKRDLCSWMKEKTRQRKTVLIKRKQAERERIRMILFMMHRRNSCLDMPTRTPLPPDSFLWLLVSCPPSSGLLLTSGKTV